MTHIHGVAEPIHEYIGAKNDFLTNKMCVGLKLGLSIQRTCDVKSGTSNPPCFRGQIMLKSSYVNHFESTDINSQPNQVDMDIVTQSPVMFNPLPRMLNLNN